MLCGEDSVPEGRVEFEMFEGNKAGRPGLCQASVCRRCRLALPSLPGGGRGPLLESATEHRVLSCDEQSPPTVSLPYQVETGMEISSHLICSDLFQSQRTFPE